MCNQPPSTSYTLERLPESLQRSGELQTSDDDALGLILGFKNSANFVLMALSRDSTRSSTDQFERFERGLQETGNRAVVFRIGKREEGPFFGEVKAAGEVGTSYTIEPHATWWRTAILPRSSSS